MIDDKPLGPMPGTCGLVRGHTGQHEPREDRNGPRCGRYVFEPYWDTRPCDGCGDVARLKVWPPVPARGDLRAQNEMAGYCIACRTEGSAHRLRARAIKLEQRADVMTERARRIREQRARKPALHA